MKKSRRFLPGVGSTTRSLIFMVGFLAVYAFWLWLLVTLGFGGKETGPTLDAVLLLLPLLPVAGFDLWLRYSWQQETPTLYPPPPTLRERLLQRAYGLSWFPWVICVPLWVWVAGLLVWIGVAGMST